MRLRRRDREEDHKQLPPPLTVDAPTVTEDSGFAVLGPLRATNAQVGAEPAEAVVESREKLQEPVAPVLVADAASESAPRVTTEAEGMSANKKGLGSPLAAAVDALAATKESPPETIPAVEEPVPTEVAAQGNHKDAKKLGERSGAQATKSSPEADSVAKKERKAKTPRPLPRVVAIANQKGGVGKTTTTVNLGAALAELDYRVLVIDLDPQGNATTGLGIDARNFELSMYDVIMREAPLEDCIEPTSVRNLFVAPATIDLAGIEIELVPAFSRELKLKRAIDSVVEDFDFVLIDCPPSLGLITVNGLAAAGEVLVPIQCEYYALEGLSQLLRNVHLVASNLNSALEVSTIVLTMYDSRTRLAVDVAAEVREHFADLVCRVVIPRTVRLSEAPSFGQPITVFDPTSRGAVAYRELAKEVSDGATKRVR
jgi:chromosome partitioning protein